MNAPAIDQSERTTEAPSNQSAKERPDRLELRGKPRPVTRLNRKTIAALTGGLLIFTALAMTWGLSPSKPRVPEKSPEQNNAERVTRPEGLARLPRDYAAIPKPMPPDVPQLGPPVGEFGQPIGGTQRDQLRQRFSGARRSPRTPYTSEKGNVADTDESASAPVFFQLTQQRQSTRSARAFGDETTHRTDTADRSRAPDVLEDLPVLPMGSDGQSGVSGQPPAALSLGSTSRPGASDPQRAFVARPADSSIYATGTLQTPRSPRQLMAGTLIRAALVTGINSDLPGQIIATVLENVFDTVTGRRLLIPQGSRLLGEYDNATTHGQRRVLLVWTRLIRPDGSSIVLDRLPGVDSAGYAGLEDRVDWHSKRLLSGAAVSSLIGIGAELATPQRSGTSGSVIFATKDSLHETVNDIGQQITKRNLDIRPTLTIRPGFLVQVIINKDLIL